MIQVQLKLKLSRRQERQLDRWLFHLTSVWNWTIKKIEYDARDRIYHSTFDLQLLINGHGARIGVPQDALYGTVANAHTAWQRCFKRLTRRPRLKGRRNKLNSVAFAHGTRFLGNRLVVPIAGRLRFHKQEIPAGRISQLRLVKRSSGWYACLFLRAVEVKAIAAVSHNAVGIDPGFNDLLTFSNGEKIAHPRELEARLVRLAQAQRGRNTRLVARLRERVANQRKDRNHKLSHKIVAENQLIAFSADHHRFIAKQFGMSVTSSGHAQLRSMLAYKSRAGGRQYIEVSPTNSTKTCSNCGALSGPSGLRKLAVRQWTCSECGTLHDRDVNAAINTLNVGAGIALERKVA